jgi:hypothetical protein
MKKTTLIILLIVPLFLAGCVADQKTENQNVVVPPQQEEEAQDSTTFNHSLFSFKLPAPYTEMGGVIRAKNEIDFSPIVFDVSAEAIESDKLLESEEMGLVNICSQTESCGEIVSNENVTIDGKNGIKFTVHYKGRGVEDVEGYIDEFHYSILSNGNLIRFWSSASDLVNGRMVEDIFDEIIKTISFK